MPKRVPIALAVVLLVVLGVAGFWRLVPKDPVYKGKHVTTWIREGYTGWGGNLRPQSQSLAQSAQEAVLAVGTNAIPLYLQYLQTKPDSARKRKVLDWLTKQRWLKHDFYRLKSIYRRQLGLYGLSILGERSKAAVPVLTTMLRSRDGEQAGLAAHVLVNIGFAGLPTLTNGLASGPPKCSSTCALALGWYSDSYPQPWSPCGRTRAEVEQAANIIVPLLLSLLNDKNLDVQGASLLALGGFGKEAEVVVRIATERLQNTNNTSYVRHCALLCLGGYGEKAKSASPVLVTCLQDQDRIIRGLSRDLLKKIDRSLPSSSGTSD